MWNHLSALKTIILSLILLLPYSSNAECERTLKEFRSYQTTNGDRVVIYIVPTVYVIKASDLACVILKEFFLDVNNMENRVMAGIASSDFRQLFMAKWGLKENYFTFIEIDIKPKEFTGLGAFVTYSKPLTVIQDIIMQKEISQKSKVSNTVSASIPQIMSVVQGN